MKKEEKTEKERCRLQKVLGIDAWCTKESCIYWRLLSPQDIKISDSEGCGLSYNDLFRQLSPDMAEWLLTIKTRLENTDPEVAKSRINFRERKKN